MKDPIVEEIRKYRAQYSECFGNDVDAMVRDLEQKQQEGDRKIVTLEPRTPSRTQAQHSSNKLARGHS